MANKSSIQKLQDLVVGTVRGVVHDPVGSAGKAVQQAKGTIAIGKEMAGQVTRSATRRAVKTTGTVASFVPSPRSSATVPEAATPDPVVETPAVVTPADVAKVVEKKSPAEKAAARKAPAKKSPSQNGRAKAPSSPSAKLPPRKRV